MYQEGALVSEQFARSRNMFHATCYYDPISYSPLNLKRHYFSPQFASSLGLWNLVAVSQEPLESREEQCEDGVRKQEKQNTESGTGFMSLQIASLPSVWTTAFGFVAVLSVFINTSILLSVRFTNI